MDGVVVARLARLVGEKDFDAAWKAVETLRLPDGVSLTARLETPTPYPAAWSAWAIADFERSMRWALRSAERNDPVHVLVEERSRPVASNRGLLLAAVEDGSFLGRFDPSEPLHRAFQKKTWVVVGGWMTALALAGWTVTEVKSWIVDPAEPSGPPSVANHIVYEGPVYQVTGTLVIQHGGHRIEITCGSPLPPFASEDKQSVGPKPPRLEPRPKDAG